MKFQRRIEKVIKLVATPCHLNIDNSAIYKLFWLEINFFIASRFLAIYV